MIHSQPCAFSVPCSTCQLGTRNRFLLLWGFVCLFFSEPLWTSLKTTSDILVTYCLGNPSSSSMKNSWKVSVCSNQFSQVDKTSNRGESLEEIIIYLLVLNTEIQQKLMSEFQEPLCCGENSLLEQKKQI